MQGSILNQIYQVQSQLSKRGSKETYLAKNLDTDELVVIKLLRFGLDAVWEDFKLFEREAITLKNIDHPAIPNYLDYFELDLSDCKGFPKGYRYAYALVQEYIAAPSLEATVTVGRTFSEVEIKEIAEAILEILQYLHQKQPAIIHRDIKPSNILLTDRSGNSVGQVYLIDFGTVKNVATSEGGTMTIVGTYGYMPPEQFGGKTTPASDLYSLGATLIYLATGKHPTELPSKDGKIAFEESVRLNYSLVRWLDRMVEPSCDRRFKSATTALQALQQPLDTLANSQIVKQPSYSKISLQKTSAEIEILIPAPGFSGEIVGLAFFATFWCSFLVVWTGGVLFMAPFPINLLFSLFSIPFWLVGLGLISKIVFTLYGNTRLKIDSEKISLTYQCLGIKYPKQQSTSRKNVAAIESVYFGKKMVTNNEKIPVSSEVIVWADGKPYRLDSSVRNTNILSIVTSNYDPVTIELDWLANELSQWLNLPLTQTKV